MALTHTMTVSFLVAALDGEMDFSADTSQVFKMALYTSAASLDETTTAYTTTGEVASGGGYTTAGEIMTISTNPTSSGNFVYLDFDNVTWSGSTITARYALIYSTSAGNPSVAVLDFGQDKVTSGADFVVVMPTANADKAILRLRIAG